jgi:hypothetical protein
MNERRDNGRFSDPWFADNQEDSGPIFRSPFIDLSEKPLSSNETLELLY